MDGLDAELGVEQLAVALEEDVTHRGVLGVAPARVLVLELGVEAQHVGERLQAVLKLLLQGGDEMCIRDRCSFFQPITM